MIIKCNISLHDFEPWSGAVSTFNRIVNEGKCDLLEQILDDLYPNGMTDTELNDLLWYDEDSIFEWLGIRSESVIEQELNSVKEELEELETDISDLMNAFNDESQDLSESEKQELWNYEYEDQITELKESVNDCKIRIAELRDEWENI